MQRTSILPSTHPVKALQGLAQQIALPHEFAPQRYPSFPALERTAVMGFSHPMSLDLAASRETKLALFRQAAWPAWAEVLSNGIAQIVTYLSDSQTVINTDTTATYMIRSVITDWVVNSRAASAGIFGLNGASTSVLGYPILGVDSNSGPAPWTYIPSGTSSYFLVTTPVPNPSLTEVVTINYELWFSSGEFNQGTVSCTIGNNVCGAMTSSLGFTGGVWVRPISVSFVYNSAAAISANFRVGVAWTVGTATYTASSSTAGQFNVTGAAAYAFVPVAKPTEFANSQLPWYSTRTTAAALLGTNVSQVLNKGGTVLAGRVAPQVLNPWAVTSAYLSGLHPAEKAYLPLETGVYTYAPPSTDLVNFWDYTLNTSGGAASAPVHRLDNDSLVNIIYVTAGSVAEALAMTIDWHIEFRTSSALFPIGLSTLTLETLHQAQISLASVGFFFENPEHKPILAKVIAATKRYGPAALGLISPTGGKLASMGVKMLSSKPKPGPKTTSALASGMLGKKPNNQKPKSQKKKHNKKK